MAEACLVDALRTLVGKRGGELSGIHLADLFAHVLTGLVVEPGGVDDVI